MARLQSDPPEAVGRVPQNLQQGCRFARYLHFLHDPARLIHNADTGLLDRYVQSTKMVHAAILLLMLEAVTTDLVFTISLKRSTPKSSAIHKLGRPITPSFGGTFRNCPSWRCARPNGRADAPRDRK